ncbi:phage tail protein [Xenorhabdus cabanillasii]|uniref:Phage tail collar domain-containing protein n=1 Tax=Xenorhabdus cabanillasii JM26 TaxID=1427517 RepID=W1INB6_9GAMM|nr:phage tail protein [Xenorhabdus cabanillasii]PHM76972.1 phage tail fiber protein [Xenorhabdus cabanillasii JM26]CDL79904.1 Putative protein stfE (modular protein) [Xenorhabdus cabanillasii JM26]
MAKNEFLPFGIADGANVLTNDEYSKLAARTNGFSSGVAKSQELNKVWRQSAAIATVVAQFIVETTDKDVLDDGNLQALQAGLLNALRTTINASVPAASLTTAGITKLSNSTDSNAENVAATSKAVKAVYDLASNIHINEASITQKGIVQLNNATDSPNEAQAATPKAVKAANDNANRRLDKAQNGADIPNKDAFVKNLGLAGTELPVGVPIPWPLEISPIGWLKCNGSTFTASQYPKLARAYPALRLPDLRGEFIRGWDDGRLIDSGRTLLSWQADGFRTHYHGIPAFDAWDATVLNSNDRGGDSILSTDNATGYGNTPNGEIRRGRYITDGSGENETRPRNIAFNYIVRAA